MSRLGLAALALALLACQKPAPTNPGSGPPPGAGFDERQACSTDADCVAVEIACCDHCNGGAAIGVHRDAAAEVRAEYASASACADTACTLMACAPAEPICRAQRCGVRIGDQERVEPLPRR